MLWSQANLESYWNEELLNWESVVNGWSIGGTLSHVSTQNFKEPQLFLFYRA